MNSGQRFRVLGIGGWVVLLQCLIGILVSQVAVAQEDPVESGLAVVDVNSVVEAIPQARKLRTAPSRWRSFQRMPLPVFDGAASKSGDWIVATGGFTASMDVTPAIQVLHLDKGWRPVGTQLLEPRARHTQNSLRDGRVLVVGGVSGRVGENPTPLATAELFHPLTSGTTMIELAEPLTGHQSIALADGRVVVVGGTSVRVFDPYTNSFTRRIRLQRERHGPAIFEVHPSWLRTVADVDKDAPKFALDLPADHPERTQSSRDDLTRLMAWHGYFKDTDTLPESCNLNPMESLVFAPGARPVGALEALPMHKHSQDPVLLVVGGDAEGSIEAIDLGGGQSFPWPETLSLPVVDLAGLRWDHDRAFACGGYNLETGETVSESWWIEREGRVLRGPDLLIPAGVADHMVTRDRRRLYIVGGEHRRPGRVEPCRTPRMIVASRNEVWGLRPMLESLVRRAWFELETGIPVAAGGFEYREDETTGEASMYVGAGIEWFRGAPVIAPD